MTAKAQVLSDFMIDGVSVLLGERRGDGMYVVAPVPLACVPHPEHANVEPTFCLPDDMARALLQALSEHYGGAAVDARALRADYDAERRRVDRLIDKLLEDTMPTPLMPQVRYEAS